MSVLYDIRVVFAALMYDVSGQHLDQSSEGRKKRWGASSHLTFKWLPTAENRRLNFNQRK